MKKLSKADTDLCCLEHSVPTVDWEAGDPGLEFDHWLVYPTALKMRMPDY